MIVKKMKNGVRVTYGHMAGYGGLPSWTTRFVYKNRVLAESTTCSCCSNAVWTDRKRRKYRKLTKEQLLELIKNAPQAFPCCDQCRKPLMHGAVYQGGLMRCKKCHASAHLGNL